MRTLIHKLFNGKTKWNFQKADLSESIEELDNPVAGWYEIHTFLAEELPDFMSLAWCKNSTDSLALVIIDIGAYREGSLDKAALANIRSILDFYRECHYDIILRIVYDHVGNAVEREPFFYAQVLEHLRQLCPIISEYQDIIYVYQGMLIGNWGEMHTSRFLSPAKLKEMWGILKEAMGDSIYLAVRRPAYWRLLHPEGCGKMQLPFDQMGLFDDGMFGSESHLGTFGTQSKEMAGWDGLWQRSDEINFVERLCLRVPNGGEVVCGDLYPQTGNLRDTVEILKKTHVSYLNRAYDRRILQIWKNWKWEEAGSWVNISGYDYIGRHMGYRFWVKNVLITLADEETPALAITITVENVGFANFYQEADVFLEWVNADGKGYAKCLDCDMRTWDSGSTQTIIGEISPTNCSLYLAARRRRDGRKIYFANQCDKRGRVFLGEITEVHVR